MNTSRVIAEMLKKAGVEYIFGLPGGQNVEFVEQARQAGLEFVLTAREGNAAFMADLYGQMTGVPGICMSTLGPGSTNLVNGVADAFLDRAPMLAITGQLKTQMLETFAHQNVNHGKLFSPITKWSTQISPNAVVSTMRKAVRIAVADRPGPVHIDLLSDIAEAECIEETELNSPLVRTYKAGKVYANPGMEGETDVVKAISKSRRPVIIAGIGVLHHEAHQELQELAEKFGIAVATTPKAKGVIPEDHALFIGVLDMAGNKVIKELIGSSDLLLAVGFDAVELINKWPFDHIPAISLDTVPNTDQIYQSQLEIVGNLRTILMSINQVGANGEKWTAQELTSHRERLEKILFSGAVQGKLNPHEVINVCRGILPRDTIATYDVGSHKILAGQLWKSYAPKQTFASNGLSAMGFAVPGAIAAQLLKRKQKVICFVGDGGFAMSMNEIPLAVRYNLPVIIVVFVDDSLNRIVIKQKKKNYPYIGTTFTNPDIARLGEAMGAYGVRVETPAQLQKAVEEAIKLDVPAIIEAKIDPAEYFNQF